MKNILLPTDFSSNAWTAALYAFQLFTNETCTFYFLHSSLLKASTRGSMSSKLTRVMTQNAQDDLSRLKQKAEDDNTNRNHNIEIILCTYDLQDAIQAVIKRQKIDMVVMGTKGATKAQEIVFGSNTVNSIQRLKNCPLLAIPDEFDFIKPSQLAFPTDYTRNYGHELEPLKQLADLYKSHIHIVHVNREAAISETQDYNLEQLKQALESYPNTFHWLPDYDKKEHAIKDFIKASEINILVMINYKHSFIENIMNEPVIKRLGSQLQIPFLVIPCLS